MSDIGEYNNPYLFDIGFLREDNCRNIDTVSKYTIILLLSGCLCLNIEKRIIYFIAPCIIPIKENTSVKFISSNNIKSERLFFDVSFLNSSISYDLINSGEYEKNISAYGFFPLALFGSQKDVFPYFLKLDNETFSEVKDLFSRFCKEVKEQRNERWSFRARIFLIMILESLHKIYKNNINNEIDIVNFDNSDMWLSLIIEYIKNHYSKKIYLDSLSRYVHVNRTTMTRYFKIKMGMTINEYILCLRIEISCSMLFYSSDSILEIAHKCGFSSEAYFIKRFKSLNGVTPALYRKMQSMLCSDDETFVDV